MEKLEPITLAEIKAVLEKAGKSWERSDESYGPAYLMIQSISKGNQSVVRFFLSHILVKVARVAKSMDMQLWDTAVEEIGDVVGYGAMASALIKRGAEAYNEDQLWDSITACGAMPPFQKDVPYMCNNPGHNPL